MWPVLLDRSNGKQGHIDLAQERFCFRPGQFAEHERWCLTLIVLLHGLASGLFQRVRFVDPWIAQQVELHPVAPNSLYATIRMLQEHAIELSPQLVGYVVNWGALPIDAKLHDVRAC